VDWSLLGCGRSGHVTYAPAEAELRALLSAPTAAGPAWQCLRCGTFVPGEPTASGPAASAPDVRRGKDVRGAFILRIFAIERYVRALVFGIAAFAVWRFEYARASIEQTLDRKYPAIRTLLAQLGYDVDKSKLVGLIRHALTLSSTTISLIAALLAAYAVIELIEGTGLWLGKRWGEYFALIATSLGLPYEIYDLTSKITVTRVAFFAVNLALVLYLVLTRRLFGVRGGKTAYQARRRSESILQNATLAVAAERAAAERASAGSAPGAASAGPAPGGPAPGAVSAGSAPAGSAPAGSAPAGPVPGGSAGPAAPGASR
jgi:uncharacterized membrane protein (DUF2068 family)